MDDPTPRRRRPTTVPTRFRTVVAHLLVAGGVLGVALALARGGAASGDSAVWLLAGVVGVQGLLAGWISWRVANARRADRERILAWVEAQGDGWTAGVDAAQGARIVRSSASAAVEQGPGTAAELDAVWSALARSRQRIASRQRAADAVLRRLRALVDASDDAVMVVDMQGRVVQANAAAPRLFGYRAADFPGLPLDALVDDRDRDAFRQWRNDGWTVDAVARDDGRQAFRRLRTVCRNGTPFVAELRVMCLPGDGEAEFALAWRVAPAPAVVERREHDAALA